MPNEKKSYTPFLYRNLLDRLKETREFMPRVLIVGGPGLGKTTILNRFRQEVENDDSIVIDDLDRDFVKHTNAYSTSLKPDSTRAVIAAARNPEDLINTGDDGASLLRSFDIISLDPSASTVSPISVLTSTHQRFKEERMNGESLVEDETLQIWRRAILQASGGHPTLLKAGNDILLRLWAFFPDTLGFREKELLSKPPAQDEVEKYLESATRDFATAIVNPVVDRMAERNTTRLLEQLKALGSGDTWNGDATDRDDLLATGLVSPSEDGGLQPMCRPFRNAVQAHKATHNPYVTRRTTQTTAVSKRVEVAWTLGSTGNNEGSLQLHGEGNFPHSIPLRGGSWRLLGRLAEEQGGVVPIEALQADLGLPSETAVRSAIQRLVRELRSASVEDLIENVHGQGYCLPLIPHIELKER